MRHARSLPCRPLTPFVGRAAERAALAEALADPPAGHCRRSGRGREDPAGAQRRRRRGRPLRRRGLVRRPGPGDGPGHDRAGDRRRPRPR